MNELLTSLHALLARDARDEARRLLGAAQTDGQPGVTIHLELGRVAEQLGELERAIDEYNLALREQPDDCEVLRRLALLRLDRGEHERALRLYRRLVDRQPEDVGLALELGGLLEEAGEGGAAAELYLSAHARTGDPRLEQARLQLVGAEGKRSAPEAEPAPRTSDPAPDRPEAPRILHPDAGFSPQDDDLVRFCSLFAGREGVHARQWVGPSGRHGYTPVYEPLTLSVARHHLDGRFTVGSYPVRMDQTVAFAAIDLDVSRAALDDASRGQRRIDALLGACHAFGLRLLDGLAQLGLTGYLEASGWKGHHVWLFFASPVPAAAARRLGQALLRQAGPPPAELTVELFPKQSRVMQDGLGNLIKLPLGVHRVTGVRGLFVDGRRRPFPDQLGLLREIRRIERDELVEVLLRVEQEARPDQGAARGRGGPDGGGDRGDGGGHGGPGVRGGAGRRDPWGDDADQDSLDDDGGDPRGARSGAQGQDPGRVDPPDEASPSRADRGAWPLPEEAAPRPEDDLEWLWLTERCAVLGELWNRIRSLRVLSHDERLVLTYTVGNLASGPQTVNALLAQTFNCEPASLLKSRLRGHPMSCPKIRSRVPEIAAGVRCDCGFDARAGAYPTPLLHLQSLPGTRSGRGWSDAEGAPADARACRGDGLQVVRRTELQVEHLVSDLYRVRAQIERSERLAAELEHTLRELLVELGTGELSTPSGVLRLEDGPGSRLTLSLPGPWPRPEVTLGSAVRHRAGGGAGDPASPPGGPQGQPHPGLAAPG